MRELVQPSLSLEEYRADTKYLVDWLSYISQQCGYEPRAVDEDDQKIDTPENDSKPKYKVHCQIGSPWHALPPHLYQVSISHCS
jgi:phage-related protein